jgi:acetoacetyl-CoA synthetase
MTPLWTPTDDRIAGSNLMRFMQSVVESGGLRFDDYDALHQWSTEYPADFWSLYAAYAGINFVRGPRQIVSDDPLPEVRWFEGATLNYAEHLLYPASVKDANQTAIIAVTEAGDTQELSYGDLRERVAQCASSLRRAGLTAGDRVAALAPNTPETLILLLACSSLGIIFSSASPDFGAEAAAARFTQIEPRLLFAASQYHYNGKRFNTVQTAELLAEQLAVENVILLSYGNEKAASHSQFTSWEAWLTPNPEALQFAPLPFDHPLYILFSSGTTGLPKAIVHRAGGALLKHHCEHHLHCDIKPENRVFYFTTCGWMMWNWLVSALAQGATVVLYDGSPAHPDLGVLWHLIEAQRISFFGTSARYLHSLMAQGTKPGTLADLSSLRTIASTGSPLSPAGFEYVYRDVKADLHLASISGGTDIVGCFMLGVPTEPVYSGQIQRPALGAAVRAFNDAGRAVTGQVGELVCLTPLPSMPLRFWNDPSGARYRAAYFENYPGVWRHGDLIEVTPEGGIIVYGRSDATLNPGGVRIGTAEIYRPLDDIPEVLEACAVGKKEADDEVIWLFVVLREGVTLSDDLIQRIRKQIRSKASPRHVPARVLQLSALPRTRSGKMVEIAVARLVNGQPVPNREVLANPEALVELEQVVG